MNIQDEAGLIDAWHEAHKNNCTFTTSSGTRIFLTPSPDDPRVRRAPLWVVSGGKIGTSWGTIPDTPHKWDKVWTIVNSFTWTRPPIPKEVLEGFDLQSPLTIIDFGHKQDFTLHFYNPDGTPHQTRLVKAGT